ncbi:MAG: 4-phosphoerythronate dehydrogenase [candidate division KSB1 bacterium]
MLILVDENIPFARAAFGPLGEVRLVAGRAITRDALLEADALLVRSVTRVNASLLEGSRVSFVGTATIGTDHIDLDYLRQAGIAFASAAGCNANSVAEYIVAALLHVAAQRQIVLEGLTLGIVGAGNVGSRVAEKARALGLNVLLNDPPLETLLQSSPLDAIHPDIKQNLARIASAQFGSLDELMKADILTLHTPLVRSGVFPTFHLFDESRLRMMKPGSILLNTGRGEVVDHGALKKVLHSGLLSAAILDVWEHEPRIDPELVALTTLATPHIAGYSFDGKVKGTWLIYEALCRFLQVEPSWNYAPLLPQMAQPKIHLREAHLPGPPQGGNRDVVATEKLLQEAVRHAYDIAADDQRLRAGILGEDRSMEERGKYFDKLRHDYPIRREFPNYRVRLEQEDNNIRRRLRALGFCLEPQN